MPALCSACSHLDLRKGEIEIDSINSVEDTKGNNGERGQLSITNLRMIWSSHKHPKINLSACSHPPLTAVAPWHGRYNGRSRY